MDNLAVRALLVLVLACTLARTTSAFSTRRLSQSASACAGLACPAGALSPPGFVCDNDSPLECGNNKYCKCECSGGSCSTCKRSDGTSCGSYTVTYTQATGEVTLKPTGSTPAIASSSLVKVKGGPGYCTYTPGSRYYTPVNCGQTGNICGLSHISFCQCTSGCKPPNPAIDIEKYVCGTGTGCASSDSGWIMEADTPPGPAFTNSATVEFRIMVTNTGNVPLASVTVNDTRDAGDKVIGALAVGASSFYTYTVAWAVGQQTNTATVTGIYSGTTVTDTDKAYYFGALPAVDVEKYVCSTGTGCTASDSGWQDADAAPGPSIAASALVEFKVNVTNTGNVELASVTVDDTWNAGDKVIGALATGASSFYTYTTAWAAGQQLNTATVTGNYRTNYSTTTVTDIDVAYYWGTSPPPPPPPSSSPPPPPPSPSPPPPPPPSICRYSTCPPGFQSYTWGNLACPSCIRWPNTLQCPSLTEPYCCGGNNGVTCPAIACSSSTSYAIAGSTGCASAYSKVTATAISDFQYKNAINDTSNILAAYCTGGYPNEYGWQTAIAATASAAATAYAEAVAKAIYDFTIFACDCGNCKQSYTGCSLAVSSVSAQVQAVAKAQAYIYVQAIAQVKNKCWPVDPNGDLIAIAEATAEAFASSTAQAVNNITASASSKTPDNCRLQFGTDTNKAVANAVACGFVNVLASARDSCTPDVTRACSATLAMSGDAAGLTCNISQPCTLRK